MMQPVSPQGDLEAAFALVVAEARRDAGFARKLLAALKEAGKPSVENQAGAVRPSPAPAFDPYEPNIEVALMQQREEAAREHLTGLSFAQLAKVVKAQRIANVRSLFEGKGGEPASKEKIVDAMLASVKSRIKGRFSAAS